MGFQNLAALILYSPLPFRLSHSGSCNVLQCPVKHIKMLAKSFVTHCPLFDQATEQEGQPEMGI